MKIELERYIKARVNQPREDEVQAILDIFIEKKFNKGAIFKRADTISKELGFITSGSARLFIINNQGEEITGAVSQRNQFLSDTHRVVYSAVIQHLFVGLHCRKNRIPVPLLLQYRDQ